MIIKTQFGDSQGFGDIGKDWKAQFELEGIVRVQLWSQIGQNRYQIR